MAIVQLSPEIWNFVFGYLELAPDPDTGRSPTQSDLLNVRLVCQTWHKFATPRVFYTATLLPTEMGFDKWRKIVGDERLRSTVRSVVICSAPPDLANGRDDEIWKLWERTGKYPEFTNAISQIVELPHLNEVCVSFSEHCQGVRGSIGPEWEVEAIPTRLHTLNAVFGAIYQRAQMNHPSRVRSLRINNLQNLPTPNFTSSAEFKAVTKDIDELHLRVTIEFNEHCPDHDIYCVELVQFEPFMYQHWLAPLESQLTSLTLYFQDCWGVMPGTFDGRELSFPRLQTLNLGNYTIAHHDQFDWVLEQTSLKSLSLDTCYIVSYMRVGKAMVEKWKIPSHDWQGFPTDAFGFCTDEHDISFYFPGTWECIFDKIRARLCNLTDFRVYVGSGAPRDFFQSTSTGTELSPLRYITFDEGLCPTPWIEADSYTGEMEFGNNDPRPFDIEGNGSPGAMDCSLNRSKDTWDGDSEALKTLLEATYNHRRRC